MPLLTDLPSESPNGKKTGHKRTAEEGINPSKPRKKSKHGLSLKSQTKEHANQLAQEFPSTHVRVSPELLSAALKTLNERQRASVKQMGFGALLTLDIVEIPGKLGYWLVENFDEKRLKLNIPSTNGIFIDEDDVAQVLGLPRGETTITRDTYENWNSIIEEWSTKLNISRDRIRPIDVRDAMLKCEDGGMWFKVHFIVLMNNVLIEASTSGQVNKSILSHTLKDEQMIPRLNWCKHLLSRLVESKKRWNRSGRFKGPLLFLVMLYIDRVTIHNKGTIPRSTPAFTGWISEELRERERLEIKIGGFGRQGRIVEKLRANAKECRKKAEETRTKPTEQKHGGVKVAQVPCKQTEKEEEANREQPRQLQDECCDICGGTGFGEFIIKCKKCKINQEHSYCMQTPFVGPPEDWLCEKCTVRNVNPSSCGNNKNLSETAKLKISCKDQHDDSQRAYAKKLCSGKKDKGAIAELVDQIAEIETITAQIVSEVDHTSSSEEADMEIVVIGGKDVGKVDVVIPQTSSRNKCASSRPEAATVGKTVASVFQGNVLQKCGGKQLYRDVPPGLADNGMKKCGGKQPYGDVPQGFEPLWNCRKP